MDLISSFPWNPFPFGTSVVVDGAFDVECLQPETVKKQGLNLSLGTPQNPKVNNVKNKNMTCCFMLQFPNVYNHLHEIFSLSDLNSTSGRMVS